MTNSKRYPEQSKRQRERAKRYQNNPPVAGHVTHGLKRARDRTKD